MRDEMRKLVGTTCIEIYDNFMNTVSQAGGYISLEELKTMSALDLLILLSTNHVRFTFIKPKDE